MRRRKPPFAHAKVHITDQGVFARATPPEVRKPHRRSPLMRVQLH